MIREAEKGQAVKLREKIVGYHANALYLWALMQDMPTVSYTRSMAESEFKPKGSIRMAIEWLEWVPYKEKNPYSSPIKQRGEAYRWSQIARGRFSHADANCVPIPRVLLARTRLCAQLRERIERKMQEAHGRTVGRNQS